MLFNSIEFAVFLPITFYLYWYVFGKSRVVQNFFLLIASYLFYGWWDWRFLSLIAFSSTVDYGVGRGLAQTNDQTVKKILLAISIVVNIGFLALFKYFDFFVESFSTAFTFLGYPLANPVTLNIILPVGISFYTFQTLSYSIDIYRGKGEAIRDGVAFFAFVSFFPQLVAGPIERAVHLLPQFQRMRVFNYSRAVDGMRQILWGLFKKVVIADNCAVYVNDIFANYGRYTGSTLLLGATLFAFQIYGDFSGYSDIAIGTARLFGFHLTRNFAFPYFSRDVAEFWRRWHISLSTWFRDYLYIPLGGSRGGRWLKARNTLVIFVISGFWHGANWTFIAWGALNALYILPAMLRRKNRRYTDSVASGRLLPNLKELWQMGVTFFITVIAWIFFRAESIVAALQYIGRMFMETLFSWPEIFPTDVWLFILFLIAVEWLQRHKQHGLQLDNGVLPKSMRWGIYYVLLLMIFLFGGRQQQFIYFQF